MANVVPRYRQRNPRHGPREGAGQAKAYTVNEESRYILVRNIPALGATEELLQRLGEFGRVERHRLEDDHDDASEYIDVLWVQFDTVTASRRAKALAVKNPFYGSVLQISYLPQDEQPTDTRSKLDERRKLLQDRYRAHQRRHAMPDIIGPLLPQTQPRHQALPPPDTHTSRQFSLASSSAEADPSPLPQVPPSHNKRRRI
ncbi:hypothetical protein H310_09125 [Aphanomyces invadans]|uniref:RRM domain-containing protein n=1 Tax=Aphanomyces invadans TaxID=157072 RepID=A0A024TWN3_9STRA|nr:hypothetical protein H310_09125 [Aphanomyces invadans]ETV97772.1 hypothetical protein H310_09125 [Aphanomyces invadans]|eukprot:XP_008873333.1 hypothetical protein H310_09125 [Aphanomyces invadans]